MTDKVESIDVGRIERIHALRGMFGATGPSTASLAALAAQLDAVRMPQGMVVRQMGGPGSVIYFVLDGELVVERDGKPFGVFGPRSVVGVLPAFSLDPYTFVTTVTREAVALRLRFEDMLEVFEDHFDMLQAAMSGMSRNTIELRRLIRPHAGYDAELREDPDEPVEEPLGLIERMLVLRGSLAVHTHIDELAELARAAQEVHFAEGATLWEEGEEATHMLVTVRGRVQARTSDGMSFMFGSGDLVGALDTISGTPRWFTAKAEGVIVALAVERDALLDLVEDQAQLGFDILRMLGQVLTTLRERVVAPPGLPVAAMRPRSEAPAADAN
jgi:CRP-like cAMP-binding protein